MAQVWRHDPSDFSRRYDKTEYRVKQVVNVGNRQGLVIEPTRPSRDGKARARHTVLLGKTFSPDDADSNEPAPALTAKESRVLGKMDKKTSYSLFSFKAGSSVSDFFLLNKKAKEDASNDSGLLTDDASEIHGTVPISCTCEDWKWRGVRHNIARGPVDSQAAKIDRLDRFYESERSKSNVLHRNTANDNTLAASKSGCRHMVWVLNAWKPTRRVGKISRRRQLPSRYRDFVVPL